MCQWFGHKLCVGEIALWQPQCEFIIIIDTIGNSFLLDSIYHFILKQRLGVVCALQDRWLTPLVSTAHYASEALTTGKLAASLSRSPNVQTLQWLTPIMCEYPSENHLETDGPKTIMDTEPEDLTQIMLADHLLKDVSNDVEGFSIKDEDEELMMISLEWQIAMVRISIFTPVLLMVLLQPLWVDSNINVSTTDSFYLCTVRSLHVRPPCDGFPQQTFKPDDISLFLTANMCLNDTCINGCVALLYSVFLSASTQCCAVLSTHNLPHVCYNATDEVLW
ncbi:hypothetical protein PISMIDRAFT_117112 [Pisolithus microcarpus 441]|uniref:Uncharacterized protein n=1 Tax=Pisolithus microcarpus 441 TaxID=765257 RepID=A0A0C9Z2W2_9AGAM|nr:hypothetical protein PISMIDRAFT_117112 [Pisolithus microcarpus 441]